MIYLDNAATTKPRKEAVEAAVLAAEEFGNPSSLHGLGLRAEKLVSEARDTIAKELKVNKKYIYFTSGGTEANNLAILGTAEAMKRAGKRVITSKIEHPSVLAAFERLEELGYDVVYADCESDGRVSVESVKNAVTPDTILVSIMHVNNETGVIQPVREISDAVRAAAPKCVIHCDCVQSFCKLNVDPAALGADMVTVSAHKIHSFKGCGALYTGGKRIVPLIRGGEQQDGIRPGTENVAGILAFGAAVRAAENDAEAMRAKRELMRGELLRLVPDIRINGSDEHNSGSVLNVSFMGIKAEILLHSLERHEIYVSTGSACSSHKPQPSHVLTAMGAEPKAIAGAVRISFSEQTTEDELREAAEKIAEETQMLRKYIK